MPHPDSVLFQNIIHTFALSDRKGPSQFSKLARLYGQAAVRCPSTVDIGTLRFPPKVLSVSDCPPIYLWPIEEEASLPILKISYDLTNAQKPEVSLRFILLKMIGEHLQAMGFRFEAPHGAGAHSYYHSQLIRDFTKGEDLFSSACPPWLPDGQPSLCLDAREPVQLFIVAFISLYGRQVWDARLSTETQLRKHLIGPLNEMHLSNC